MVALLVFVAASIAFVLLGLWSKTEAVLGPNQCRMTYTSLDHRQVPVNSFIHGPRLLKYSNALTKKLNKQPVLFIPGHQGRCDTWAAMDRARLAPASPSPSSPQLRSDPVSVIDNAQ